MWHEMLTNWDNGSRFCSEAHRRWWRNLCRDQCCQAYELTNVWSKLNMEGEKSFFLLCMLCTAVVLTLISVGIQLTNSRIWQVQNGRVGPGSYEITRRVNIKMRWRGKMLQEVLTEFSGLSWRLAGDKGAARRVWLWWSICSGLRNQTPQNEESTHQVPITRRTIGLSVDACFFFQDLSSKFLALWTNLPSFVHCDWQVTLATQKETLQLNDCRCEPDVTLVSRPKKIQPARPT